MSLADDPLRILKGIRHATSLGLALDAETLHSMQNEVTGLYRISVERVRQEIWKIFASQYLQRGIYLLSESKAGSYLFGNNFPHTFSSLEEHCRSIKGKLERLSLKFPVTQDWFAEEYEQGLSRSTLLVWTLLLSRVNRDLPARLAGDWLLSRKSRAGVAAVLAADDKALSTFSSLPFRDRSFALWAARLKAEPRLLLLALSLRAGATPSMDQLLAKWAPVVDHLDARAPEDLVDGNWLQNVLGLQAGPELTRAHQLLRDAEIAGEVVDREGACKFLRRYYENID